MTKFGELGMVVGLSLDESHNEGPSRSYEALEQIFLVCNWVKLKDIEEMAYGVSFRPRQDLLLTLCFRCVSRPHNFRGKEEDQEKKKIRNTSLAATETKIFS